MGGQINRESPLPFCRLVLDEEAVFPGFLYSVPRCESIRCRALGPRIWRGRPWKGGGLP